jgi:hypothetical protein
LNVRYSKALDDAADATTNAGKSAEASEKAKREKVLTELHEMQKLLGLASQTAGEEKEVQAALVVMSAGVEVGVMAVAATLSSTGVGIVVGGVILALFHLFGGSSTEDNRRFEQLQKLQDLTVNMTNKLENRGDETRAMFRHLQLHLIQQFDDLRRTLRYDQDNVENRLRAIESMTNTLAGMIAHEGNENQKRFQELLKFQEGRLNEKLRGPSDPDELKAEVDQILAAGRAKNESEEELKRRVNNLLKEYLSYDNVKSALKEINGPLDG